VRVLIDSGSYHALNVGDVAMLQAAVGRLRELWPQASISAITNAPATLALCCPAVEPVPLAGRVAWTTDRFLGRADELLPSFVRAALNHIENALRRWWPAGLAVFIAIKSAAARRDDYAAAHHYIQAIRRADLVIATGAGVFTDAFLENAHGVLTTLTLAQRYGVPTVLTGQGLGPVANQTLRRRMSEVLPRVELIALRERHESLRLLHELGVAADRVMVTGDDALEMAHRAARADPGDASGINLRVAGYAGTSSRDIAVLRSALRRAAAQLAAPLVAVPIAHHPDCHDGVAIRDVIADDPSREAIVTLPTPADAIAQVSRCRVVVTGSYHAAVFALAQGIPVVAVAASDYYVQKFAGLADLFPGGCGVIVLADADADTALERAVVAAWNSAPTTRETLLHAAAAQIAQGRAAYRRLRAITRYRREARRSGAGAGECSVVADGAGLSA
jgi:colanic acid/amylovoran biosynthesis protein